MGMTFDNFHLRGVTQQQVVDFLNAQPFTAFVSEVADGWVSVFPFRMFSPMSSGEMAGRISGALSVPALRLWEYDSDCCGYRLFTDGELMDEYESHPDIWAGEYGEDGEPIPHKTPEERERLCGQPEVLLPYCRPDTTTGQIMEALNGVRGEFIAELARFQRREPGQFRRELQERMRTHPDEFIQNRDAHTIMAALVGLLGISSDVWHHSADSLIANAEAGDPFVLVGGGKLSQAEKDHYLRQAVHGTPLHNANSTSEVRRWLTLGAKPNPPRPYGGYTYMFWAVEMESPELVAVLADGGCDLNERDEQGRTPLTIALGKSGVEQVGQPRRMERIAEVVRVLREYGAEE